MSTLSTLFFALCGLDNGVHFTHWRATLQNAQTREVLKFATERQLIQYLLETLDNQIPEPKNN